MSFSPYKQIMIRESAYMRLLCTFTLIECKFTLVCWRYLMRHADDAVAVVAGPADFYSYPTSAVTAPLPSSSTTLQ